MSVKDEIIRVFKREVIAYPEGAVVHMGDCNIYNAHLGICTCGLHHWLMQAEEGTIEELYPEFMNEKCNDGFVEYLLQEFQLNNLYVKEKEEFVLVEEPEPISDEEFNNFIDKLRKKGSKE